MNELSDGEDNLNVRIARALGWNVRRDEYLPGCWVVESHGHVSELPDFLHVDSLGLAQCMEEEIGRRGLWWAYLCRLHERVNQLPFKGHGDLWYLQTEHIAALLRATPEQRAKAFLAVMK